MVERFFQYFIRSTHFWRTLGYRELAELYTSRMLRVMAMQMAGVFAAVYLYQLGYSLQFIAWFFCGSFTVPLFDDAAGGADYCSVWPQARHTTK